MKILLTGAAGQLGNELYPKLSQLGEVIAADRHIPRDGNFSCVPLDLGNGGALEVFLNRTRPDLVVNAAAYTAVDRAENEPEIAFAINAKAPGRIARWVARHDRAMLHYSTDYVFDGAAERPYVETDTPGPLNTYGESKLAGEHAIAASGCRHIILRSSWVYSLHGNNFVLSMLQLAKSRMSLNVVDDQVGCPTWARNLAAASETVIRQALSGDHRPKANLYHCSDHDKLSWYDFAQLVFDTALELQLITSAPELVRVGSDEYPQVARRPKWSALDCRALEEHYAIRAASLRESLGHCLKELKTNE